MLSRVAHAAAHAGCRRNASSGTANVAAARGSIATGGVASARGSIGTRRVAPAVAAAVSAATAIVCEGDLAGRQMAVDQRDGCSGQRRTNNHGNHEPLHPHG
jgi:hypothetical protein